MSERKPNVEPDETQRGKPVKIDVPFEDALRAALETPPPTQKLKKRRKTS